MYGLHDSSIGFMKNVGMKSALLLLLTLRASMPILLCALASACAARSLDLPSNADLGSPSDLADSIDAAICGPQHQRVAVALTQLGLLGGESTVVYTMEPRLEIAYSLRDCDIPADVELSFTTMSSANAFDVVAYVWQGSGSCGAPTTRTLTIDFVLPAAEVPDPAAERTFVLSDGAPGASVPSIMLTFEPASSPGAQMGQVGDPCIQDFDCMSSSCLNDADGQRRCGDSCNDDVDCVGASAGPSCAGAPDYLCGPTLASCEPAISCGFGEALVGCVCQRTPLAPHIIADVLNKSPCGCDADCPTGTICGASVCLAPCRDDDGDTASVECAAVCGGEGICYCADGACVPGSI